jgi:hypothetical protein
MNEGREGSIRKLTEDLEMKENSFFFLANDTYESVSAINEGNGKLELLFCDELEMNFLDLIYPNLLPMQEQNKNSR